MEWYQLGFEMTPHRGCPILNLHRYKYVKNNLIVLYNMSSENTVFMKFPGKNVKGYSRDIAPMFTDPNTIRSDTSSADPLIPNNNNKKWENFGKNVFDGKGGKRKQNRSIKKRQSKRRRAGTKRRR